MTYTEAQLLPDTHFLFPPAVAALSGQSVPPEVVLCRLNGPILRDHACMHFTSSVLNTFMTPATHPMENKWVPVYLQYVTQSHPSVPPSKAI